MLTHLSRDGRRTFQSYYYPYLPIHPGSASRKRAQRQDRVPRLNVAYANANTQHARLRKPNYRFTGIDHHLRRSIGTRGRRRRSR